MNIYASGADLLFGSSVTSSSLRPRFLAFAINEQLPGDYQPRGHLLRLFLDDVSELGHGFGARAAVTSIAATHRRGRETFVFGGEVTEHLVASSGRLVTM